MNIYRQLILPLLIIVSFLSCKPGIQFNETTGAVLLKDDVSFLADDALKGRQTASKEGKIAAKYIAQRMSKLGLVGAGDNGSFLQGFEFGNKKGEQQAHGPAPELAGEAFNVLGMIDNPGDDIIVIGAHYDHLGMGTMGSLHVGHPAVHNGADDNASGVAVILELARRLKAEQINDDILFIGFSGEEWGLIGSANFVRNPTVDASRFKYMLNFDMVGRLDEQRGIAINGTGTSAHWDALLDKSNPKQLKLIKSPSGTGASDHTSFYYMDIPVLHYFTGQHEDYHKPSDDIEKVNFEGMKTVCDMAEQLIRAADNYDDMSFQKTKGEKKSRKKFSVTLGVMPDYLFDGKGLRIDGVKSERPADMAGIIKGDIVIKMGDLPINDIYDYMNALGEFKPGDKTKVTVLRNEKKKIQTVKFD